MANLQMEVARIGSEGRVLVDCWIAKAKPGAKKNKYPRLKSRKPIFNGKKTEYLSIQGEAIAEAQTAIDRGKTVKKLNKRIKVLSDRIAALDLKSKQVITQELSQRWYPPPEWVALARQVMETIDLDPISDGVAQQWVQAAAYYTFEQDGLSHPWFGRVWLYPPTPGKAGKWTKKAITQYEIGNITEAIVLVKSSPSSKWFQKLIRCFPTCFPNEEVRFLDDQGHPQPKSQSGNAFFYLGQNPERFKRVFGAIGSVSSPV